MKKKLSLLLALVMILSLVPMGAFAESDNTVNKVPKVADDKAFEMDEAPVLRLEEDIAGDLDVADTFRLTLEGAGAEWNYEDGDSVSSAVYGGDADFKVDIITDTILEVELTSVAASGKTRIDVPMFVSLDGKGEAKVVVDPRGTTLTQGTYTYAVSSAGETVVTVSDATTVKRGSNQEGAQFVIDETSAGALSKDDPQKIELELPEGFEWDKGATNVELDSKFGGAVTKTFKNEGTKSEDKEVLVLEFTPTLTGKVARSIVIEPVFEVTRDADLGDVELDIKSRDGDISSENNILIAEYKDFGVVMEIEEVEEFYAGRVDQDYVTAEITLSENAENSIIRDRVIEFELPKWVQITKDDMVNITDQDGTDIKLTYKGEADLESDTSVFEMELTDGTDAARDIKFEIPLTIEADKTGDIELTVSGAGIEEQTIVVAEAVAPVEVEIEMADVRVGIQDQEAPDILIKEVAPGALQEDSYLTLEFDNDYDMTFEDAEFEVVSGDIKLDLDKSGVGEAGTDAADEDKTIDIYIDRDSDEEEAVIKVTGIKMSLDRSVPEGPFDLKVKGDAIVENSDYNDGDFTSSLASVEFANVITKASTEYHATSKFIIGSTEYTVLRNGVEVENTMDVAPFISADGRTLLPVRYMAEAVGLSDDQISWDETSRTVTLFGEKVVQIKIDSRTLTVNGTPVAMDAAAIIKDGRTFLPARFIAQALGFDVEWDGVNQVVTIEK